jgi:CO/xanthine dehydrogenase FAD-binding subunit
MNFRLARPGFLVDVNPLRELDYIRESNGHLEIGALTRQASIERSDVVARRCPLLAAATRYIGHAPIRHRGTIGGSLAHADPSAEYPAVLLALDGEVTVLGPSGERTIPGEELFLTICTTCMEPGELLVSVRLRAVPPGTGWSFLELNRRHGDFALVGVAAVLELNGGGICERARIALCGAGPTPIRIRDAEAVIQGQAVSDEVVEEAAQLAAAAADPVEDIHGAVAYKRSMVEVFVRRALNQARERAGTATR